MLWVIVGIIAVLIVLWLIVTMIQNQDRQRREQIVRQHKDEKAKEEERSNRFPS